MQSPHVDPARAGLGAPVLEYLAGCGARRVVYVSCNPATQARDLAQLCGVGPYELAAVQPVDMFPHTEHVESVALLTRRA
jgi:tRNA/tmRNA/rRNA uracil-C5-methylase (TrmA/RlmC/RlmD family)